MLAACFGGAEENSASGKLIVEDLSCRLAQVEHHEKNPAKRLLTKSVGLTTFHVLTEQ